MVETANLSDRNLKSLLLVQTVGVPLVSLSARSSYATTELVFRAKQRATRPLKTEPLKSPTNSCASVSVVANLTSVDIPQH